MRPPRSYCFVRDRRQRHRHQQDEREAEPPEAEEVERLQAFLMVSVGPTFY
jgi:hypothetical protein